jgi:hypothetical protein
MRHSNVHTTLNLYAHAVSDAKLRAQRLRPMRGSKLFCAAAHFQLFFDVTVKKAAAS